MSERGTQLRETADAQISELKRSLVRAGRGRLSLACPGREKLGDGKVAACALHTADRYQRIAGFLRTATRQAEAVSAPSTSKVPGSTRHPCRVPVAST